MTHLRSGRSRLAVERHRLHVVDDQVLLHLVVKREYDEMRLRAVEIDKQDLVVGREVDDGER